MNLIERLKHARRVSAPLISITTADQIAVMKQIAASFNNKSPIVSWNVVQGTLGLNELGKSVSAKVRKEVLGDITDITVGNLVELLSVAVTEFPAGTIIFVSNADQFLQEKDTPTILQAIANCREPFKQDSRMLILLSPSIRIPSALRSDFINLDDDPPTKEQLKQIVIEQDKAATAGKSDRPLMSDEVIDKTVESVQGLLSAFSAEQVVAMALRADGIDLNHAWSEKKAMIEQTKGLSLHFGEEGFDDLGGLEQAKDLLTRLMKGRKKIRVVVWLDEIGTTGIANRGDTSGVNADAEGTLLSFMEDKNVYGVMLLGVPGCGKSALCKAMAKEFGVLVIRLDLGGFLDSLVGSSQQNIRTALKVIEAVGGNETLWIATANNIEGLSAPMRSRYTDTLFFDSPTQEERSKIWNVWMKKLGIQDNPHPIDDGWVGRDIRHCCEKAWMMNCSIAEAAEFIIPSSTVEREEYERQRRRANGRYLNASAKGVYKIKDETVKTTNTERTISFD